MADEKVWPALVIRTGVALGSADQDALAAMLDDYRPVAVQDLAEWPLPPGGLWDPTYPPIPDPPPSPLQWRVFFSTPTERDAARNALHMAHPNWTCVAEEIADEDWAARTQRELTAVRAGDFVVAPPWDVPEDANATVIIIEPSRGFGTGHHASTRLCLRALSTCDIRGKRVLDLGTGSGVLAIAAALRGAREVLAVDIDLDAIDSAHQSAALNPRAGGIDWLIGDFREQGCEASSRGPWDLILANLTGGMLISSAARIRELLAPAGVLVCSGFDESERARVEQALALPLRTAFVEDTWVGLVLSQVLSH